MSPFLVDALGLAAGALTIGSSLPQLLGAIAGQGTPHTRDLAQIRGRTLQLASNLLWMIVGWLDSRIGLIVPCGLASGLLLCLIWVLWRSPKP